MMDNRQSYNGPCHAEHFGYCILRRRTNPEMLMEHIGKMSDVIVVSFASVQNSQNYILEAQTTAFNFDVVFTSEEIKLLLGLRGQYKPEVAALLILTRRWEQNNNRKTILN